MDAHSFGYEGYHLPREFPSHSVINPVTFSSDGVLIASFLTRATVTAAPHRGQPNAVLPVRLHGVFLDAATGNTLAGREWSTAYPGSVAIFGTRDGQFVVVNREHVALYSGSFKPLKELDLATPTGLQGDVQLIEVSPDRRSLLLVYLRGKQRMNWIDASNLGTVYSWDDPRVPSSVSDDYLAIYRDDYVRSRGFLSAVVLRNRRGGTRTVCRSWSGCGIPQFVSKEALVLYGPHEINLVDTGGKRLLAQNLADDDWITDWRSPFRPSADGNRFAVAIWAHRGGSDILDISAHSVLKRIMVFDIPSRRWIYTLSAKKQKLKTILGLALSPDGTLLALINQDGILEVFRLPPADPGSN